MSKITELIKRLNKHVDFLLKDMGFDPDGMVISDYKEAIETIQHLYTWHVSRNADIECLNTGLKKILSEKLSASQTEPCDGTISRSELLKAIDTYDKFGYLDHELIPLVSEDGIKLVPYIHYDDVVKCIKSMPSVQPKQKVKPISYQDCANAMLMMWIDKVLTDGEFAQIMDKLNAHEKKMKESEKA